MLFDPKWDAKTKADPFSLHTLIAWLEQQNLCRVYCYTDHGKCLLSQYFAACGFKQVMVYSAGCFEHDGRETVYPIEFDDIAVASPHTFRAALARARARRALASAS